MTDKRELLRDSLSEDESHPPPYTSQPRPSKVEQFRVSEDPRVKVADAPLNTIYLGLFATIFCLWPCGLVAVILGLQAMQSHYRGELYDARRKNTLSKRFSIASIVIGVIVIVLLLVALLVEFFAARKYFHLLRSQMAYHGMPEDPTPVF